MLQLSKHLPGPNIALIISESKCKDATFISASSGAEYYPNLFSKIKTKMRHLSKYISEPNINLINFRSEKQICNIYVSIFRGYIL